MEVVEKKQSRHKEIEELLDNLAKGLNFEKVQIGVIPADCLYKANPDSYILFEIKPEVEEVF